MSPTHQSIIRAAIALQVAVLEHADQVFDSDKAIDAMEFCNLQIANLMRQLKKGE